MVTKPLAHQHLVPKTARGADKHVLYQLAVQDAVEEAAFVRRTYKKHVGREPLTLREDFCGTALLCAEWARSDKKEERSALGVDLDPSVLAWGRKHNLAPIGAAAERVRLVEEDVRTVRGEAHDVIGAFNFSYWIFRTRDELRRYFELVRAELAPDGLFFLDAYGGWESQEMKTDRRRIRGGVVYRWEQASFDPIDHSIVNYIHFELPDGTKLEKAFTYEWRYWTLPELRELLAEAGFGEPAIYWCEDDGYRLKRKVANQPAWLAYLVVGHPKP